MIAVATLPKDKITHGVTPRCPHFGVCGGCQYQDVPYAEQLELKRTLLSETMVKAGVLNLPEIQTHSAETYEYRNRIRLRLEHIDDAFRFGYNQRGSTTFLPIVTCPIAAPVLWRTAEAILALIGEFWLDAADEVELFCDAEEKRVQITFLCRRKIAPKPGTFALNMEALRKQCPWVVGAGAVAIDKQTGRVLRTIDSWGAEGLAYRVLDEAYWVTRGGFFQINRFLVPTLVDLVCAGRSGAIAWDLFAGVGLFSRVLAKQFQQVTSVEANPVAATDLRNALKKLGAQHHAVEATTLDFLERAIVDRERPDLIVLDPPRAGAGPDVCQLLLRMAPREILYVSCDPVTLARDLWSLTERGYKATELHMVDLFPQTAHVETVVVLRRDS